MRIAAGIALLLIVASGSLNTAFGQGYCQNGKISDVRAFARQLDEARGDLFACNLRAQDCVVEEARAQPLLDEGPCFLRWYESAYDAIQNGDYSGSRSDFSYLADAWKSLSDQLELLYDSRAGRAARNDHRTRNRDAD